MAMIQNTILTSAMLIALSTQGALAARSKGGITMQEKSDATTLTISEQCVKLRQETGKPYEVIKAVLTKPGSILSPSSISEHAARMTQEELLAEEGTLRLIYQNNTKGVFTVGFAGTVNDLQIFNEILSYSDNSLHIFCAYHLDNPKAWADYVGNAQNLKIMEK